MAQYENNRSEVGTVYFVHKYLEKEWPDLIGNDNPGGSCDYIPRYKNGRDGWIITTYLELLNRGNDVKLSDTFIPGKVCVSHHDHIVGVPEAAKSYVVAIKADRALTYTCENEIVQSPASLTNHRDYFIPYWPQSNIIPRDPSRGAIIENIVFMGRERNLAVRFREAAFQDELAKLGVKLHVADRSQWHDYENADLVLAIRDGGDHYLASKPASKLVNAWIAGVPAVLGSEPAFNELRRSELDFFPAQTEDDVLAIVRKLKESPDLYKDVIRNGSIRAEKFTFDAICEEWERVLFNEITPNYVRWQNKQKGLWGYYPVIQYRLRTLCRTLFSRRYSRGYDRTGERLTLAYRLKKKFKSFRE